MLDRTEEILADLIAHPTVSSDPNAGLIDAMATRLEDAGARVEVFRDETGDKANLWASIGPDMGGGVMLSGHSDVGAGDGWGVGLALSGRIGLRTPPLAHRRRP